MEIKKIILRRFEKQVRRVEKSPWGDEVKWKSNEWRKKMWEERRLQQRKLILQRPSTLLITIITISSSCEFFKCWPFPSHRLTEHEQPKSNRRLIFLRLQLYSFSPFSDVTKVNRILYWMMNSEFQWITTSFLSIDMMMRLKWRWLEAIFYFIPSTEGRGKKLQDSNEPRIRDEGKRNEITFIN